MHESDKLVSRSISIKGVKQDLFSWLEELPAVVHLEYTDKELTLQYDASQLQWSIVLQLLKRHNIYRENLGNKLKTAWYNHSENKVWSIANER